MEVELSEMHSRLPHLPHKSATPAAGSTNEGRQIDYVETNAAAESEQPSRAQSTTFPAVTPAMKIKARIQFATLCWSHFMAGWNDGTTGPLLPRIQSVYHVGFAVVSLIFVFNCIGFVAGAAANVWLTDRLGFGKVMVIGALVQVVGYSLAAPAPPFPVFILGYAINGFGLSLQDASANGFVASLKDNASTKMGILHAIYGMFLSLGALSSPLVATQFSQITHWSFHYLVSLGIALSNVILLTAVFRFKDQETCLTEIGQTPSHEEQSTTNSKYSQIFGLRALHLLAFFILIYVGVEVTLGGWIVTYVIQLRGGGPSSGYISSGFFGGITLGRIGLLWVNQKIGEQRAIYVYATLAIALELVIWLVPSLIGGGIAVSFVGVLLGPIYPIVMNHAARVLPPWILTGCIGWIAGFGQAGSALLPFLTGALASRVGIKSLQPLLVSMMGFMVFLWALVPRASRRVD
ncbi:MFS general substrate transporter [Trametes versicolor FP-101664 SS1]|uniref:MFS general substrate transporter n=1 Tax=Trametes versicolor (strain FP-101664) TaxID=717944 RepID=UPI0004622268|nr:MFS general substrate transporter [Trametes versicolor FP-101664 SS1]EIW55087.1 MFS general substrate transporter [Trametes versicolor FP-101664 SS1]